MYCVCIDIKLDCIVGVGTCYMGWGLTPVGARDYPLHTHVVWSWGPPCPLTMAAGALSWVWCWSQLLASVCHLFAWNYSASSGKIFMKFC